MALRKGIGELKEKYSSNKKCTCNQIQGYIQEQISSDCANDDFLKIKHVCSYFIVIWIHYNCYPTHQNLVFQSTLYKFIVLGSLGLDPFTFGLRTQIASLQLAPFVGNSCVVVSLTFSYGRFVSKSGEIYKIPTSRSFSQS